MRDDLLRVYMNDHLAGSVEAVELVEHLLEGRVSREFEAFLRQLLAEIKQDQAVLRDLQARIGGRESRVKDALAWLLEKVSRLKLSERSRHRDLNRLEKLEGLMLGIRGKLGLWTSLEVATQTDDRFGDVDFQSLKQRAQQQHDQVEARRVEAARKAFAQETGAFASG